jgi:cytoskeletal protein CcmA (bactofilin family)
MSLQDLLASNNQAPSWSNLKVNSLIAKDFFVQDDIAILGDISVDGNLEVSGTSTLDGHVTINDQLTVTGLVTGVGVTLTEDIQCRTLTASSDVNVTNDLTVNATAVVGELIADGLAKFNNSCQAVFGVTYGSSLNSEHTLSLYHTITETGAVLTNTNQVATVKYNRIGNIVFLTVYETSGSFTGFTAIGNAAIRIPAASIPLISAQLTSDLAGRTYILPITMKVGGPLYESAMVVVKPFGEIDMYEAGTTYPSGIVSATDEIFIFGISFSV